MLVEPSLLGSDEEESGDGGDDETGTGSVQLPIKSTPPSPFPPILVNMNPRCRWR